MKTPVFINLGPQNVSLSVKSRLRKKGAHNFNELTRKLFLSWVLVGDKSKHMGQGSRWVLVSGVESTVDLLQSLCSFDVSVSVSSPVKQGTGEIRIFSLPLE